MIYLENSLVVHKPLAGVFALASDFESYPRFLASVKKVAVLSREKNRLLIQRTGTTGGNKEISWKSEVTLKANEWIRARQIEGPIPGMLVEWRFAPLPEGTRITISHQFNYDRIPVVGNLIGRLVVARIVSKMADTTLAAIKKEAEEKNNGVL